MGRLFGTDGIRGVANVELTPDLAFRLGRTAAHILTKEKEHMARIIIGTDTRASCDMLEAAFTAGACSVGAHILSCGVIPTPAIPILIKKFNLDAGVVISASHNPCEDNGIKLFDDKGFKLPDALEDEIESLMLDETKFNDLPRPIGADIGRREVLEDALRHYVDALKSTLDCNDFKGINIAVDCANGATYKAAPLILDELCANTHIIHNKPDGENINKNCGSTHMEELCELVVKSKVDIGLAFDGDGDRFLAVDENGNIVDGDQIMSICANFMKENGKLAKNTVVCTVMTNLGFFHMCQKYDINVVKTKVGDRYVLDEMRENGYIFGGEQSGHIIFLTHNTTGDGILTAIQLLQIMKQTGKKLSELNSFMKVMPQALVNARVANDKKNDYLNNKTIMNAIENAEKYLSGDGRILIRPSGTEPCVRVMIEGKSQDDIDKLARDIANLLEQEYPSVS